MKRSLLDTDILSYILAARYPEVNALSKQYHKVFGYFTVSVITICEIVEGLSAIQDQATLASFRIRQESYEVLPIETDEAILAGEILGALRRSGQSIGDLDPFIAASAIVNDLPLITNNQEHYKRIVDLGFPVVLDNWRKP